MHASTIFQYNNLPYTAYLCIVLCVLVVALREYMTFVPQEWVISLMEIPQTTGNRSAIQPSHPILGIYLNEMKSVFEWVTYNPCFRSAHYIIAETWNQPRGSSTNEWWIEQESAKHLYHGILLGHKKEWNLTVYNENGLHPILIQPQAKLSDLLLFLISYNALSVLPKYPCSTLFFFYLLTTRSTPHHCCWLCPLLSALLAIVICSESSLPWCFLHDSLPSLW